MPTASIRYIDQFDDMIRISCDQTLQLNWSRLTATAGAETETESDEGAD